MFHFQIRRLLSAYADGELDQSKSEHIQLHVQQCKSCTDNIENILFSKKAVSFTTNTPAPERIWEKIENELFDSPHIEKLKPFSRFSDNYMFRSHSLKYASAIAGITLLLISIGWWTIGYIDTTDTPVMVQNSSEIGFDYGGYLDAVISKMSTVSFSESYDGIPVNLEIAHTIANEGNFHLCLEPKVVPNYDLQKVLVLTDGDNHSLKLDYENEGDLITIFQQPISLAHSLGERDTQNVMISGVACQIVIEGDIAAISWEAGNTRFLAVGNSGTIDFEEIVSASIKHNNL